MSEIMVESSLVYAAPMRRVETVDASQIRHLLSNMKESTAAPVPPPLQRGASDLSHVRATDQKIWWTGLKKKAFTLSFNGHKPEAATQPGFEIASSELKTEQIIGEGCRSRVYAGTFKGRKVAIKQLRSFYDPENAEKQARLVQDLQTISSQLRHPNIVQFFGVNLCRHDRQINLVFENMEGGTLEDFFDSQSNEGQMHLVKRSLVISWSLQLFRALKFLHERKTPIIYRDLQPCNLLLSEDLKTLKLRDCGISKTADLGITVFSKTRAVKQEIKTDISQLAGPSRKGYTGTKRYMAPECFQGEYTPKADIYSAALIMWLLLESERPWESHHGYTAFEISKAGSRPPLRTDGQRYPAKMADLIARCWAGDADARPEAGAALAELEEVLEEETLPPAKSSSCFLLRSMRG